MVDTKEQRYKILSRQIERYSTKRYKDNQQEDTKMLRHSTQRYTTLLHSHLIDDYGTWVRKIIIYKAHKCLLRSWTLDTGHALPDRTAGKGAGGATTHSSHELSSQSAQIPDLESDSDSDLDSASDALASCVEVVGIMTTLGVVLPWARSWGEAGNWGLGNSCGLSVAASSSASGPVSACPRRICIGIGLALVVQVRVYLAYDALYTPSYVSLRLSPRPSPLPLFTVCLSISATY